MKAKSIRHIAKKATILIATVILATSTFYIPATAGMLGSDSISGEIYDTTTTGYLAVYDTETFATTSYSRSGSDISISATINATYRSGGKNLYLSDYNNSNGGGVTAQVEISLDDHPNAVFLDVTGSHEVRHYVNGMLLSSGYWLESTKWER